MKECACSAGILSSSGGQSFVTPIVVLAYYLLRTDAPVHPNAHVLLLPVLIVLLAGLGLGFGILFSSFTTKYRDLSYLLGFFVQLWMYATPVIYPLSTILPSRNGNAPWPTCELQPPPRRGD